MGRGSFNPGFCQEESSGRIRRQMERLLVGRGGSCMTYEKAKAELIVFDNSDVITASGLDSFENGDFDGGGCKNNGQDRGNGCNGNSGKCPGQSWK